MNHCWNNFLESGSVAAYLQYVADETSEKKEKQIQKEGKTGDNPYAGFSNHNGNGNEGSTYW